MVSVVEVIIIRTYSRKTYKYTPWEGEQGTSPSRNGNLLVQN